VDGSSGQRAVDVLQAGLAEDDDIGSVFCLYDDPVVLDWKMPNRGVVASCELVQAFVECTQIELIGQSLRFVPVVNCGVLANFYSNANLSACIPGYRVL
jgi:hypothetical protein